MAMDEWDKNSTGKDESTIGTTATICIPGLLYESDDGSEDDQDGKGVSYRPPFYESFLGN